MSNAYLAGVFAGMPVNKSNGGVRSSKIRVECWLSDCCNASMRNRKFASSGFCWNTGSDFRGLGLALAADARGVGQRRC